MKISVTSKATSIFFSGDKYCNKYIFFLYELYQIIFLEYTYNIKIIEIYEIECELILLINGIKSRDYNTFTDMLLFVRCSRDIRI